MIANIFFKSKSIRHGLEIPHDSYFCDSVVARFIGRFKPLNKLSNYNLPFY